MSYPFAQRLELVGACAPAFLEAHLRVPLAVLLGPVPGAGGVARAAALGLDFPHADHERPGRLEIADDRIGEGEPAALVPGEVRCRPADALRRPGRTSSVSFPPPARRS